MLTETERQQAADALLQAERTLRPIPQLSKTSPASSLKTPIAFRAYGPRPGSPVGPAWLGTRSA